MTTAVNANWRLSSGTAAVLGLLEIRMQVAPTTAYIMLGERCLRNCAYCAQAHGSTASEAFLSRVTWPLFSVQAIARALADAAQTKAIRRVCLRYTQPRVLGTLLSGCSFSLPAAVLRPGGYTRLPSCSKAGADR